MYQAYVSPASLAEALAWKRRLGAQVRVCAGGTDLLLELARDPGARIPEGLTLLDLTRIPGLAAIARHEGGRFSLGPLVTHNQCLADRHLDQHAFPLVRACWEVGAPALRNRATVAGNIITASPANDTIVPLSVLDTDVTVASEERGERQLPLASFITGYRATALAPDELVTRILFRGLCLNEHGIFIKLGMRSAQAISVVSAAVVVRTADRSRTSPITGMRIALGAVGPVVIRAEAAEQYCLGRVLDADTRAECGRLAASAACPMDDVRGTADYRSAMVGVLVQRALEALETGTERMGWNSRPVMLWGDTRGVWPVAQDMDADPAATEVNGQPMCLEPGMTLMDSLRTAGCHEVKKGCAEGECGSCTVFLDGMAVLSCLIPAERAAGSRVITASGLAEAGKLGALQQAFVHCASVQCGYCIPGFIMSGTKLLEEVPAPTRAQAQEAYMGNLCRCTGYAKILDATLAAGQGPLR